MEINELRRFHNLPPQQDNVPRFKGPPLALILPFFKEQNA